MELDSPKESHGFRAKGIRPALRSDIDPSSYYRSSVPGGTVSHWRKARKSGRNVDGILVRGLVSTIFRAVHVQHLKAIGDRVRLFPRSLGGLLSRKEWRLQQGLRALVGIPFNPHSLVHRSGHHTGARKQGVVNRVQ